MYPGKVVIFIDCSLFMPRIQMEMTQVEVGRMLHCAAHHASNPWCWAPINLFRRVINCHGSWCQNAWCSVVLSPIWSSDIGQSRRVNPRRSSYLIDKILSDPTSSALVNQLAQSCRIRRQRGSSWKVQVVWTRETVYCNIVISTFIPSTSSVLNLNTARSDVRRYVRGQVPAMVPI